MTDRLFVDTNVLVYSRDASEPEKQKRAFAWRAALWRARSGCLSTQVLNEYYRVVTRKLTPGLSREEARREIRDLFRWKLVHLSPAVMTSAWHLEDRFQLAFWDALVVAAAQAADCRFLLSEDFQDEQDLDGVTVVNPFRASPEQFLPEA